MRILFERNIASKYTQALASESWTTVEYCSSHFAPTAPDREIAAFAKQNDWVVMTLDDDFFQFQPGVGVLLLAQYDNPAAGDVVDAVEAIGNAYSDHSAIAESVPGRWV